MKKRLGPKSTKARGTSIIPETAPKCLTSDTTSSYCLLIFYAYSIIPKLYVMDKTTTEEVMDKLDMFQSRCGKIDAFLWWDLEIISADAGMQMYLHVVPGRMPNLQC